MEHPLTGSFIECTKAFRRMQLMIQLFTKQSTSSGQITTFPSFQMSLISSKPVEIAYSTHDQEVVVFPDIRGTMENIYSGSTL